MFFEFSRFLSFCAEKKYHDHGQAYTTLTNVSTAQIPAYFQEESMITSPRGDQPNQRNGRKIMIRDVDLRIGVQIERNSVAGVANVGNLVCGDSTWRIVMYLDTQCNQAVAPITEVFEMTTSNEHPIDSFNNLNTSCPPCSKLMTHDKSTNIISTTNDLI